MLKHTNTNKEEQWDCTGVFIAPSFPTVNNLLPDSGLESNFWNNIQPSSLFGVG